MRFYPEELRNEARSIASSGKGARLVWADLKQWASKRGPAAMKSAVMEFLGEYGGTPEAAYVMPEILRNTSHVFSREERGEITRIAAHGQPFSSVRGPQRVTGPRNSLPMASGRPELSLAFKPAERGAHPRIGAIEPVAPHADHAYLRDMPIRARERLEAAIPRPMIPAGEGPSRSRHFHFDPRKSPDSLSIGAHKGERIVRNLIHSIRMHGRDEHMHLAPPPAARGRKGKAARARKPARTAVRKKRKTAARPAKAVRRGYAKASKKAIARKRPAGKKAGRIAKGRRKSRRK
jgi:hypothetical protein